MNSRTPSNGQTGSQLDNISTAPTQAPYARHIFLCSGGYCDPTGLAERLYRRLAYRLGELGAYDNPLRVKRGLTPCLGVCSGGPLLVIYPDGIWYHHVTEAILDRIIDEHLVGGIPVQEYIFHRLADNPELDACASAACVGAATA